MNVDNPSREMFLVGAGISHSLSPAMWNHLFAATGAPIIYGLHDVPAAELHNVLDELATGKVLAANVTMPHKQWASAAATRATDAVTNTGAANLLLPQGGGLMADNTDVSGARGLLARRGPYRTVTMLGAGGTAAAISEALVGQADEVRFVNRTFGRGAALADVYSARFESVEAVAWEDRDRAVASANLVVNTVPAVRTTPFDVSVVGDATYLYDVMYRPEETALQRAARGRGLAICDGLTHLAAQAVAMLEVLDLGLGDRAPELLVEGLETAAGRPVEAWGGPLN